MNINLNQIIAYALYLAIVGIGGYITKEYKAHNKKVLELQQEANDRANKVFGQQTVDKAKKIVTDAVYEMEQLGKENNWEGTIKHTKVLEVVEDRIKKLTGGQVILTDDEIFDIIKTTVGYINAGKDTAKPINIAPIQQ